jgi:BirA family biotin operon repressor/biotin-[acetyl-CoA-carboxylase] ligase
MSYVVRVPTAPGMLFASSHLAVVPVMCGFAVCCFFNGAGASVQMKWPNDVLAQHKKLAGMLCESVSHGDGVLLVVGLGVNVLGGVDAPDALDGAGAIALEQILPTQHHAQLLNLPDLAQGLALQLHQAVGLALREGLAPSLNQIHALDAWRHRPVQVRDNGLTLHTGIALGIDASGCYLIQEANGRIVPIVAGDLSLRLLTP